MPKTAIVTGAASGIGLATAQRLARDGWTVGMIDLSASALADAAGNVIGGHPITAVADVTDADALGALFGEVDAVLSCLPYHLNIGVSSVARAKALKKPACN